MGDINIGQNLGGLQQPGAYDPSVGKDGGAAGTPRLAGIFKGENVSVSGGFGLGDLDKLLSTLKMEDEDSRAKSLLSIFTAQLQSIVGKDAVLTAQALLLDAKIKSIENLIESMKPTKEELEAAQRRKADLQKDLQKAESLVSELESDLAAKRETIASLDVEKDAEQIAALTAECTVLEGQIETAKQTVESVKGDLQAVENEISEKTTALQNAETEKNKLVQEVETGIQNLANAAKKAPAGAPLTKAEAENGVVEDVDPVEEREDREEELEKLGILTDIFQVWRQSLEGVQEADLKYGPALQALRDEIDTNKPNLV